MRFRTEVVFTLSLLAAASFIQGDAAAQGPYPVQHAGGAAGQLVDAYGNPAVIPTGYGPPGAYGGYGGYGAYNEVADPFGGAGLNIEQTGPHYFDISGEFVYWKRSNLGSLSTAISADIVAPVPSDNIVLTTDALDPDFEPGFRLFGRYDIGALSVIEIGYTGLFNQNTSAAIVTGTPDGTAGNLFSPFTNFGATNLEDGVTPNPFLNGIFNNDLENFEETDRALSHSIAFESDLQTAEISYRRYWVGYSPRVTGTLIAGARLTQLNELFSFRSSGADFAPGTPAPAPPAPTAVSTATLSVEAENDLAGFQLGADTSIAIRQGIRLNAEGKLGLYNNDITVTTLFTTSDGLPAPFTETLTESQVAFISDARVSLIVDVLPSVSIKAGYEVLFLNSVATALDNLDFNGINDPAGAPVGVPGNPARVVALQDQGDAVFHGAHLGLEWIW